MQSLPQSPRNDPDHPVPAIRFNLYQRGARTRISDTLIPPNPYSSRLFSPSHHIAPRRARPGKISCHGNPPKKSGTLPHRKSTYATGFRTWLPEIDLHSRTCGARSRQPKMNRPHRIVSSTPTAARFCSAVREGTVPSLCWGRIRIEDAKISELELYLSAALRCRLPGPRPSTRAGCPAARSCGALARPCSTARSRSRINAPIGERQSRRRRSRMDEVQRPDHGQPADRGAQPVPRPACSSRRQHSDNPRCHPRPAATSRRIPCSFGACADPTRSEIQSR